MTAQTQNSQVQTQPNIADSFLSENMIFDIKTSRFGGRIELAPITVVLGPPGAGKTSLLRIIAGALSGSEEKMKYVCLGCGGYFEVWLDGREIAACSSAERKCECTSYHKGFQILFLPIDFETILKGGSTYDALVEEVHTILKEYRKGYRESTTCPIAEFKDPYIKSRLEIEYNKIYEMIPGNLLKGIPDKRIHISRSASAAKVLVLEELTRRGLLDRFDYILMDQPDAGLHPVHVARLAAWMHALAACGKKIIIATHNLFLVDVLYKVARLKELGLAHVEPQEVAVYYLDGHTITPVPQWAGSLGDYTDFVLKFYGLK